MMTGNVDEAMYANLKVKFNAYRKNIASQY